MTFVIPSSGGDLSLYSVLDSDMILAGVSVNFKKEKNCSLLLHSLRVSWESQESQAGILTKLVTLHYIVPDLEGSQALPA